jgi:hypothetical protein
MRGWLITKLMVGAQFLGLTIVKKLKMNLEE